MLWFDRERQLLARLAALGGPIAVVMAVAAATYACRYARWRWLLLRDGHRFGWWRGFGAYLGGFAFTATPGKVGELVRIRGFGVLGVPAPRTIAVFVFERALDLIVVLALSLLVASRFPAFALVAAVVLAMVAAVVVAACWAPLQRPVSALIAWLPGARLRALATTLFDGLRASAPLWRPRPLAVGLGWGVAAWTLTAAAFAWLCAAAGLALPPAIAFGIYPLAMLAGAVSFVPGGVGTTEAAIVLLLTGAGVATADALAVAIGARLATLWFAVAVGLVATACNEWLAAREARTRPP